MRRTRPRAAAHLLLSPMDFAAVVATCAACPARRNAPLKPTAPFPRFRHANFGARDRTRTCTPCGTCTSNMCVYQFHHPSISKEERGLRDMTAGLSSTENGKTARTNNGLKMRWKRRDFGRFARPNFHVSPRPEAFRSSADRPVRGQRRRRKTARGKSSPCKAAPAWRPHRASRRRFPRR